MEKMGYSINCVGTILTIWEKGIGSPSYSLPKKEKKSSRWIENHECSRKTPECLKITLEWEKQEVFVMEFFLIQICLKYSTGLTYTKKLLIVYQKLKFNWVSCISVH